VGEKRPTNSELNLRRLEEEEARRAGAEPRGIFEIFPRDEDAPLSRDQSSWAQASESARADSTARKNP